MSYNHETIRKVESEIFPGVTVYLNKMTEGRRIALRAKIGDAQKRIREIMREQAELEKVPEESRDNVKWLELSDELDGLMIEKINPAWILWGCKKIDGLESDGQPLSVENWPDWPSALFDEILTAIRSEAELNGTSRKNLSSLTTSGDLTAGNQKPSTAEHASGEVSGEKEIAENTLKVM